jgi:hypothetical protein
MPFITFLTPTYRRPKSLSACLASVQAQTAVADIQHVVLPDHVGLGVGGMFTTLPAVAPIVRGQYVHILCDDDVLASPRVVEQVKAIAAQEYPVIVVRAEKGGAVYPIGHAWPPCQSMIDLGCLIVRADVWAAHVEDYGDQYEGDFAFASAVAEAGHAAHELPLLFLVGAVSRGAAE